MGEAVRVPDRQLEGEARLADAPRPDECQEPTLGITEQLRQLPTKTQMPEIIVDISRAALSSGIHTELFQPEAEVTREFYAEKPIALRMVGSYHQFGDFVSTVASLPRVIILASDNMSLRPRTAADGRRVIVLEGIVKTFRSLDEAETLEQEKLAEEARKKAKAEEAKRKKKAKKEANK